jgi:integrase
LGGGINRLSALEVTRAKEQGRYPDGGGLYLQVGPKGGKSWLYRYMLRGRAREMGLGPFEVVSLSAARDRADECRRLCFAGIDPIEARQKQREVALLETANALSFAECAEAYVEAHRAGWRNEKHADQWRNTLKTYTEPVFGSSPVKEIELGHVMRVLEPIWTTKPETAGRLRGRIEAILDWATVRGHRRGENPARWRGHLEQLLPKRGAVRKVEHHPALPFDEVGSFLVDLRKQPGIASTAFEFLILTAARTSEVVGARWSEIDFNKKIWTVPADRIKAGREHRVPLSARALTILKSMAAGDQGEFVFPSTKADRPLSNMALLAVLKRMKRTEITAHGFRSTFRDWAAERTSYPREVAEMALAHAIGDKVEAAYRRGDLFEKRLRLMEAWAKHCETTKVTGNVVSIAAGA